MNRLLCLVLAWLGLALFGCSAAQPTDEPEDDACKEPAVALVSEELSSISCAEHGDTGYSSGNAFPITVVTVDGKPVERSTANAYYVMAQAAAAAGVNIQIVSGFRTMAQQQYLYGCYVNCSCNSCNLAAKPGYSNHQSGHALDLNTSSSGVLNWLNAHGAAYGFKRTVPSEAWHWEWWGGGPGGGPCGTCKPHCEGSLIVSTDCGEGDCGAYGATCVDDSKGVRCASVFCPAVGQKKVCVNDKLIGDCNDGAISTGDCSFYGAACVDDAKGARCVAGFCADKPATAHDLCLPNGQLAHCTNVGGISVEDCPAGKPCTPTAGGAQCGAPPPPPPPSGTGGSAAGGTSAGGAGGAGAGGTGSGLATSGGAPSVGTPASVGGAAAKPAQPHVTNEPVEAGCGCRATGEDRVRGPAWLALFSLIGVVGLRRRGAAGRRSPLERVR
ncbi:MAG: D-alanyl-D-alanine carboxypeptidase family protein [Myxococcales bacterium]|nr:D-alanyl-D-alanine carboxypeptidase family protein [Myxococcales bacterium]